MRRNVIGMLAVVLSLALWGALAQPAGAISGSGQVATNAREGVLINASLTATGSHLGKNDGSQCTGVLVTDPNVETSGETETRAVLTAGHCIYAGPLQAADRHWDVGAPYAPTLRSGSGSCTASTGWRTGGGWQRPTPTFTAGTGSLLRPRRPATCFRCTTSG